MNIPSILLCRILSSAPFRLSGVLEILIDGSCSLYRLHRDLADRLV